jgi:hypothetical protein
MTMNNNRGIYVTANTSINNGRNTRLRGFHMAALGGSGTIHFSNPQATDSGTDFRIYVIAGTTDNLQLPEGGVRFPKGVSVSVPTSVVATLFIDP